MNSSVTTQFALAVKDGTDSGLHMADRDVGLHYLAAKDGMDSGLHMANRDVGLHNH